MMQWIKHRTCGKEVRGHFNSDWTVFFVLGVIFANLVRAYL